MLMSMRVYAIGRTTDSSSFSSCASRTMSCGTTGTPLLQRLRCGGSMRVCSVAYRLLDGTEFIGRGIAPDAECEISADDLRAGTDSVLREALRRLREA